MIPILTRIRAKSAEEFGELVHHSGEEYIHVLEGAIKVFTEFYDPVVLTVGESIYIDSKMGHAYVTADGWDEAIVLGVCSSTDESLLESLLTLHGDPDDPAATVPSDVARQTKKSPKKARR
jgi:hypothetical protein